MGGRLTKSEKNLPRAGWLRHFPLVRATSREEVDVISAQLCSCARAIFSWVTLSWSDGSLPPIIVDNCPNIHNTCFFPGCHLLYLTNGSIWILNLARHSEINKKPNFQVVKWKTFSTEKCFPGGIGNQRIPFGYNLFFLPPLVLSRLSPSLFNQWVHLDTESRQIFRDIQKTQFPGSKMEDIFIWKMLCRRNWKPKDPVLLQSFVFLPPLVQSIPLFTTWGDNLDPFNTEICEIAIKGRYIVSSFEISRLLRRSQTSFQFSEFTRFLGT